MHGSQSGNLGRLRDRWEGRPGAAAMIAVVALVLVPIFTGCASDDPAKATAPKTTTATTSTAIVQNVMELEDFAPLEPGTYFIDPDADPSTPLRVVYEVPVEGWLQWFGAFKESDETRVSASVTTVRNVVRHGCRDHRPADPAVGPRVGDLAAALADLAPFRVTSPPKDVTVYGYRGKHLELTVPDLPVMHEGFTGCVDGNLASWIAAPHFGPPPAPEDDAFYGYTGPGYTEEFWILDVEGTRLMIAAGRSPDSPQKNLAELRALLDSIRIEP
jgi:hypothetical protein